MNQTNQNQECCPVFEPALWDEKPHNWINKPFIKDSLPQIFHIPLPSMMGKVVGRMWTKAQEAGAATEMKDFLLLAYDPSPWKSELYMSVSREVPGAENVNISGTFLSKVFDGPYNHVPKYIKELDSYLAVKGEKAKKYYFYFTTCPKCAKKYGHNYIVAFGEI